MLTPAELFEQCAATLASYQVQETEFQSAVNRLYASGVVALNYSDTEDADFRTCRRAEEFLKAYFSFTGWNFIPDRDGLEFRLYPPSAVIPGEEDTQQGCQMRLALPREAARIALACHLLYDQALRSGDLDETSREALVRVEDIATVLSSRLRGVLPKSQTEVQRLFDSLRQCRYLRFTGDIEAGVSPTIIGIRPALYQATNRLANAWLSSNGTEDESESDSPTEDVSEVDVASTDTQDI